MTDNELELIKLLQSLLSDQTKQITDYVDKLDSKREKIMEDANKRITDDLQAVKETIVDQGHRIQSLETLSSVASGFWSKMVKFIPWALVIILFVFIFGTQIAKNENGKVVQALSATVIKTKEIGK